MSGNEVISALKEGEKWYTVGDQCTLTFIEENIVPDIFIIDYRIKREPNPELAARFQDLSEVTKTVVNPAGMITRELWSSILESLSSEKKTKIEVDGEEDLAALPCIFLAQDGAQVAYGLPDRGVVLVNVNEASKEKVKRILERMGESNAS
ncbi:MAG: GTP-dependent dephospho-CoA kinase family protein [Methanobacteriota archaeon]|nr:MAG: GTP-dependent dephospho-CoA kinase family protein [Euryarchaeota archaeon]